MKRFLIVLMMMALALTVGCSHMGILEQAADIDIDVDSNDAVDVGYGGTNATTATAARTNLGLGSAATRAAEDTMTDGNNLPDGAAIIAYAAANGWGSASVEDVAFGAAWNGDLDGTSKNSLYDYLINFDADADGSFIDESWYTGIADSTAIGLAAGNTYTNFGAAGDDTIDELMAAIDTAIGGLGGGHAALTLGTANGLSLSTQELSLAAATNASAGAATAAHITALEGATSSVLDDTAGAVPILYQSFTAIASTDATPDVSAAQHFRTANASATTITDFDGTMLSDGRLLIVFINDANTTIDLSSSGIEAGNRSTDYAANNGDLLLFMYSTTDNNWHALNMPDAVETVSTDGFIRNDAGVVSTDVYGTTAGTVAQGNDSRFTDARTPTAHDNTYHTTNYEAADTTILKEADVDDTPVDGATAAPVSSNRMYDHENASNPHSISATTVSLGNVDNTSDATKNSATATLTNKTLGTGSVVPVVIGVALSDETTALTTGTAKATIRMPFAMTLSAVRASVTTAPTTTTIIVDINEGGSTIMTTNKLSIDATEETSTTAATSAGITDTALADDGEITFDIDQIGSGTAGAGLKVWLIGTRTL